MSALVIGNCCPCVFTNQNESQSVTAVVHFMDIGAFSLGGGSSFGSVNVLPPGRIANVVYLRSETKWESATGVFYQSWTQSDIDGNVTVGGFGDPNAGPAHGDQVSFENIWDGFGNLVKTIETYQFITITIELTQPYTFAQAAASAVSLLDQVDLINPLKSYQVYFSNGFAADRILTTVFCYPSEYQTYGGHAPELTNNSLYVCRSPSGQPAIFYYDGGHTYERPLISPVKQSLSVPGGQAVSGATSATLAGGEIIMDGTVWARKSAVRSSGIYTVRGSRYMVASGESATRLTKTVFGTGGAPNQSFYAVIPVPGLIERAQDDTLNPPLGPGELLYLPGDVGGLGASRWA